MLKKKSLLSFNYNKFYCYTSNKTICKNVNILNKKKFLKLLKFLKIFFLFNIYIDKIFINFFFIRFNAIRILNNINKTFISLKFLNLINLNKNNIKIYYLRKLIKKKKYFRIRFFIKKNYKFKIKKKIKLKFPLFFFNKFIKKKFFMLINYYNNLLNLKIEFKNAFINYWSRWYKYNFKRIFIKIEIILKKFIYLLYNNFKDLNLLMNLKKYKKKKLFFFFFFFNGYKYKFLRKNKIYLYYKYLNRLLNINFYKKNIFNLMLFNYKSINNIKKNNLVYKLKKQFNILSCFFKIKFLIFFRYFIFIFFMQFLIFWFNYYIINKYILDVCNFFLINYDLIFKYIYTNLVYKKKNIKLNQFLFLKYIYFFYINFIT